MAEGGTHRARVQADRAFDSFLVLTGTVALSGATWVLVWLFAYGGGPSVVGDFSFALAVVTPVFVTAQLGLRNVYLTLLARHAFATYLRIRIASGVLAAGVVLATCMLPGGPDAALVAPLAVVKFADGIMDICFGSMQRRDEMRRFGTAMIANAGLTVAAGGAIYVLTGSVAGAVWASAAASLAVVAAFGYPAARREMSGSAIRTPRGVRAVVSAAVPVGFAQSLNSLLGFLPVLVLGLRSDVGTVGVFAAASYVVTAANLVCAAIQQIILPRFAALVAADRNPMDRSGRRRALVAAGAGLLAGTVTYLAGPWLLVTVYGTGFEVTPEEILPLAFTVAVLPLMYVTGAVLLALNRYGVQTGLACVSVLASAAYGTLHVGDLGLVGAGLMLCIGCSIRSIGGLVAATLLTRSRAR